MQVNKWLIYFGSVISFLAIVSCSKGIEIHKSLVWKGTNIRVLITNIYYPNKESDYIIIFGDAEFSNYGKEIKSVDLNCLSVSIGNSKSEQTNVSSLATYFTKGYPLSEKLTRIPLSWSINNTFDSSELDTLSLFIENDCILFSDIDWKKNSLEEHNMPKTTIQTEN